MKGLAIDYSWTHPDPHSIAAAEGFIDQSTGEKAFVTGVLRYLSNDPTKNLTAAEAAALHDAGLGVGLIWETTADRALGGGGAGAADGALAVAQAKALGYPDGAVLLVNLGDFTGGDIGTIHSYYYEFRRVAGFTYQPGGYATGYKIDQLVAAGAVGVWWQNAMNDGTSPGSTVSANATIYQRTRPTTAIPGGNYDENVYNLGTEVVAWWEPAPPPVPVPVPVPVPPKAVTLSKVVITLSDGTEQSWAA